MVGKGKSDFCQAFNLVNDVEIYDYILIFPFLYEGRTGTDLIHYGLDLFNLP